MEKLDVIEIDTRDVIYYSQLDEAAFFGQLDNISCVADYTPTSFRVSLQKLDERNLRELIACCYRSRVDMRQLATFDLPEYSEWLRNENMYWYKPIFG